MAPMTLELTVPQGKVPERLDVYLTHHVQNATRTKVQQAIREGMVLVDGRTAKPSYLVAPGDVIEITLPRNPPQDLVAEDIPLTILFEDDYLIVLNKPAGMVTHPAYANYSGTLVNAVLFHSRGKLSGALEPTSGEQFPRPGIVHRLDKDTSGLMIVAKDDVTHAHLAKQFSRRTIEREYRAIVIGTFSGTMRNRARSTALAGVIDAALGRSPSNRKKIAVTKSGKPAITEYRVIREFKYLSLVSCKLRTGRTHQIRVHMQHIGHPVFGDSTYGGTHLSDGGVTKKERDEFERLLGLLPRQALHARTLGFCHPHTNEMLRFESEVPPDMQAVIDVVASST